MKDSKTKHHQAGPLESPTETEAEVPEGKKDRDDVIESGMCKPL